MKWSYGVTTVPQRLDGLLPRTLTSLAKAGFDKPRLFVDGADSDATYKQFVLEVTTHYPALRTFGTWTLALAEMYLRDTNADRYAVFQDDFVTYLNLRDYLEHCTYPVKGYWNLYTFPKNLALCKPEPGWYLSNQLGKGAVALVFDREAVIALLSNEYTIIRPQDPKRGWKAIDGGIVTALKNKGWKEYIHNPSLVQHTGITSSMGNKKHELANSFRGEDFDARGLIPCA